MSGPQQSGPEPRSDGAKDGPKRLRRPLRGFAVRSGPVLPSRQVIHRELDPAAARRSCLRNIAAVALALPILVSMFLSAVVRRSGSARLFLMAGSVGVLEIGSA